MPNVSGAQIEAVADTSPIDRLGGPVPTGTGMVCHHDDERDHFCPCPGSWLVATKTGPWRGSFSIGSRIILHSCLVVVGPRGWRQGLGALRGMRGLSFAEVLSAVSAPRPMPGFPKDPPADNGG